MRILSSIFSFVFLSLGLVTSAQNSSVIQDYIDTYKEAAIAEMQRTGVPASIKLAQGIHETMAGTSVLVRKSNNHFGIKCKSNWAGASVSHDDDARGECFRKYDSPADSYRDHSNFLRGSSRYASLFKLDPLDYKGWAYGLKKAGYATNPKYPQIIIKLIEDYNLQDYTLIAMGKGPVEEELFARNEGEGEVQPTQAILRTEGDEEENIQDLPNYPTGEFAVNGTRVIYAKKGTSFLAIAREYDIALSKLFEYNDLEEMEELDKDQLVYLQRKRKTGQNEFHTVRPGESLHDIAQQEAMRLDELVAYNHLSRDMHPLAGSTLYLKGAAPARPNLSGTLANTDQNNSVNMGSKRSRETAVTYVVKPRETVYSIAKRHNVTVGQLVEWNGLKDHKLSIGQQLKIYK